MGKRPSTHLEILQQIFDPDALLGSMADVQKTDRVHLHDDRAPRRANRSSTPIPTPARIADLNQAKPTYEQLRSLHLAIRATKMTSAPERRLSFSPRTLFVVLALCWLVAPSNPDWSLLLLNCALLGYVIHSRDELPDRVASHFRLDLQANGWVSRRTYLVLTAALGFGLSLLFVALAFGMRRAQVPFMPGHLVWFGCLFLGLLFAIQVLIVRANRNDPAKLSKMLWALLAAFQIAIVLWVAAIISHGRWGWPK
jgi:hypothetical protein